MISHNLKQQILEYFGSLAIVAVYKGSRLVWAIFKPVLSCFGNGYWVNSAPWSNTDGWKNNN